MQLRTGGRKGFLNRRSQRGIAAAAIFCSKICLRVLLFALRSNVLLQNETAHCEKWQDKPLPISGYGRQRPIDIQNSLDRRVIRSSANGELKLPAPVVWNLNQGRIKQAVCAPRDLQWNVLEIRFRAAGASGREPRRVGNGLCWLERGKGSDHFGIENRAFLFLNESAKVHLAGPALRWIGEYSHYKGWSGYMQLYRSSVGQSDSQAQE